jgi:hypothetical protein
MSKKNVAVVPTATNKVANVARKQRSNSPYYSRARELYIDKSTGFHMLWTDISDPALVTISKMDTDVALLYKARELSKSDPKAKDISFAIGRSVAKICQEQEALAKLYFSK